MDPLKKSRGFERIINRPESMNRMRRYGENTFTVIFWWLWVFWFRPVLLLLLWVFGIRLFFTEIAYEKIGMDTAVFLNYMMVVIIIYSILLLWNRYNYMHFHGKDRRKMSADVTDEEMADFYGVRGDEIRRIKNWKKMKVNYLADNSVLIESGDGETDGVKVQRNRGFSE